MRCPALAIAAAVSGCAPSSTPVPETVADRGYDLAYTLQIEPDAPLASYAWDGRPAVPVAAAAGPWRIDYGESGADELTRLYETFDQGLVAGRFGKAQAVAPGTRVIFEGTRLFAQPFVLSFWVKPGAESRGQVILKAGPLMVALREEGDCRVRLDTQPPLSLIGGHLDLDEWNHVAVALDGPELQQLRLVVNGSFECGRIEDEPEFASGEALVVGREFVGALDDLSLRGYPVSTADLIDRGTRRAAPGEHELELRFADRTERLVLWAGLQTSPMPEAEDQWNAAELRHVVFDGERLRRVPAHWERIYADNPPLARTTHPTVYVGDGRVFLVGGETRDTHGWVWKNTNDTWIFHTKEERWERIESASSPEPTCHQPAAYSPDHGFVLYAGGWRNDVKPSVHYGDTWRFYPAEGRWEKREPAGVELPPVSNCALVYHPGLQHFLLFTSGRPRAFAYDPGKDRWGMRPPYEAVDEAGNEVEYRTMGSPMVGHDPRTGDIVVFGGGYGGEENRTFSNETAIYSIATNRFTVLDLDEAPSPRVRSGFAYDSKREYFVLFGGVQDHASQRNNDLWIFDPRAPKWIPIEASNPPTARGGYYGMAYDPELDRFFLLCGRHSKERFLDEAWSLSLDGEVTGEATYVFDRSAFAERAWFADVDEPGDSSVGLRFRATEELGSWGAWTDNPDGSTRYVMVRVSLAPGTKGEEPSVSALGFR